MGSIDSFKPNVDSVDHHYHDMLYAYVLYIRLKCFVGAGGYPKIGVHNVMYASLLKICMHSFTHHMCSHINTYTYKAHALEQTFRVTNTHTHTCAYTHTAGGSTCTGNPNRITASVPIASSESRQWDRKCGTERIGVRSRSQRLLSNLEYIECWLCDCVQYK